MQCLCFTRKAMVNYLWFWFEKVLLINIFLFTSTYFSASYYWQFPLLDRAFMCQRVKTNWLFPLLKRAFVCQKVKKFGDFPCSIEFFFLPNSEINWRFPLLKRAFVCQKVKKFGDFPCSIELLFAKKWKKLEISLARNSVYMPKK